jgi:hypothetical protein
MMFAPLWWRLWWATATWTLIGLDALVERLRSMTRHAMNKT